MPDFNKNKKDILKKNNDNLLNEEMNKSHSDEFMQGVTDDFNPSDLSNISRRKFLALMSASAALTATACTDYHDKGEIVPYTNRPEEVLPGKANYYASTCDGCSQSCGVLIKTREGRPIKVDGNPDHPINQGKICAKGQSSILNLYDPERLKQPLFGGDETEWKTVDKNVINALNMATEQGAEIAIISHSNYSPTRKKLLDDFKSKYPTAKTYFYELFDKRNRLNAWKKSYGNIAHPTYNFDEAKVILTVGADFLGKDGDYIENTRLFTSGRDVAKTDTFNRLYVAEGGMSLTGMNSDYRFRVRPDAQYAFIMCLINEVIRLDMERLNLRGSTMEMTADYHFSQVIENLGLNETHARYLINDLIEYGGQGLVYGGDTLNEETHIAINLLNEILGNTTLYNYKSAMHSLDEVSPNEEWWELFRAMKDSKVGVVIHLDSNPVYHLSAAYGYRDALSNVKTKIALVESEDETSELCDYVLPVNNQFESWGDAKSRKNIYSLQQPVIAPIFNTRQKEAVLLHWLNGESSLFSDNIYHKYLMTNFRNEVYDKQNPAVDFKSYWYSALHDGVVKLNVDIESHPKFIFRSFESMKAPKQSEGFLVHLQESYFVGDGRYANNGWLQELPHPVSKVTWDNFAMISPDTAAELNVVNDDFIKISTEHKEIILPVMIQPGVAEKLVVVELGYGRMRIGNVGKDVGVNANLLLGTGSLKWVIENP
ncbi:molybdopterin dinucleotide binding domain-containing protein, partial [Bacteroidota bacterium]